MDAPLPILTDEPAEEVLSAGDPLDGSLRVNETFHSIQGESTWAGCPCLFIRLTGCPLRCRYCDTEYAFREGSPRSIRALLEEAERVGCPLVELTGGEPLAQKRAFDLVRLLCDRGFTVLIETSGAIDTAAVDPRAIVILDVKTPGSGESGQSLAGNLARLRPHDEVKLVITSRGDYEWARDLVRRERLPERVKAVLFSPVFAQVPGREIAGCPGLEPRALAEWILADRLPVRMQTQLHKQIWDPGTRGV